MTQQATSIDDFLNYFCLFLKEFLQIFNINKRPVSRGIKYTKIRLKMTENDKIEYKNKRMRRIHTLPVSEFLPFLAGTAARYGR